MPGGIVCSVATCSNNAKKAKESGEKLSFFTFPNDLNIQKQWVRRCHRKDKWEITNKRICSKHFQGSDMEDEIQARIMNVQPKRLKKGAIPSLFLPHQLHEKSEETDRSKRMELKNRKKLTDNLVTTEAPSLQILSTIESAADIDLSQALEIESKIPTKFELQAVTVKLKRWDFDMPRGQETLDHMKFEETLSNINIKMEESSSYDTEITDSGMKIEIDDVKLEDMNADVDEFKSVNHELQVPVPVIKSEIGDIKLEDSNIDIRQEECKLVNDELKNVIHNNMDKTKPKNPKISLHTSCGVDVSSESNLSGQIKMFVCNECDYKTSQKMNFKKHHLFHKEAPEIKMYKCIECVYQAKYRSNFKSHLLVHKKPSQITMLKCDVCSFETRQKGSLKIHKLRHEDSSEIEIFKCDQCNYRCKLKSRFKEHMMVHTDQSELEKFICNDCGREYKHRGNLIKHVQVHK